MANTTDTVTAPALDAITNDLAALKRDFAALLADLRAAPTANMTAAAEQLTNKAANLCGDASAQAEKGVKLVAQEIEARPLTSLLLAFSVGFIASRLLSR